MTQLWDTRWVLLAATGATARIFLYSAVLALALSFVAGVARSASPRWVRWAALVYGELFRGVSLVVQLFWLFFVLPLLGVTLSPQSAAILGLGLCFGAYGAESVRVALAAVPAGQLQAAQALGLSRRQAFFKVELPQALPVMLPPLGNLMVMALKATSVTAMITVPELTFTANALTANLGASAAVFAYVGLAYYAMAKLVLWISRGLERRVRIVGRSDAGGQGGQGHGI